MGEWKINSIRKKVIGEIDSYDCKINLKLKTRDKQFSYTYDAGAGEFDTKCVKDALKLTSQLLSGRLVVDWFTSDTYISMVYLPKAMANIIEKTLK